MKNRTLYIIQGFIGAGKSTFSKKLAFETGAVHLNPDEFISKLYSKEEYSKNWNECFDKTVKLLWEKTRENLLNNQDVIFDMGFWYKKDRDFARMVARECKANVKHYYLYVPDNILKERIVSSRPQEWAKIHLENFDKNKNYLNLHKLMKMLLLLIIFKLFPKRHKKTFKILNVFCFLGLFYFYFIKLFFAPNAGEN